MHHLLRGIPLILLLACSANAATINAASGSRTDVNAAIALSSAGDTVVVPADTESWSGGVSISGITLRGPGWNAGSPMEVTAGLVTVTKHASQYTKLIGFKFSGTDAHLTIVGDATDKAVLVESNYFDVRANGPAGMRVEANGIVFAECVFFYPLSPDEAGPDVFQIQLDNTPADESWDAAPLMGNLDTTGEGNNYFERCYWTNVVETAIDNDQGGRTVIRHSIFHDSGIVMHGGGSGTSGNDSSLYGNKYCEIYKNTFERVANNTIVNRWAYWRGGGGIFVSNTIDAVHSSAYPNKPEIELGVCCPGAYPLSYQVGQTELPADSTPDFPILIFGNDGAGASSPNFITLRENPNCSCGSPSTYIIEGRDWTNSNSWGWAPYTYPHPLTSAAGGGGGSDPGVAGSWDKKLNRIWRRR